MIERIAIIVVVAGHRLSRPVAATYAYRQAACGSAASQLRWRQPQRPRPGQDHRRRRHVSEARGRMAQQEGSDSMARGLVGTYLRCGAIALALGIGCAPLRCLATEPFRTQIARKHSDGTCTSGYLAVNGSITAYTLELPWQGNEPLISSIPSGLYDGTLRYDHTDQWRIELVGVPGRGNVQIHTGNGPDQTEGCILVGLKLGIDLRSVQDSKAAYRKLKNAFYGSEDPA